MALENLDVSALIATAKTETEAEVKSSINKIVWALFDSEKTQTLSIHLSIFHIPINPSISVSVFEPLIVLLVGSRPTA